MTEEKMAVVRPSILVSYDDTYHIIPAGLARINNK